MVEGSVLFDPHFFSNMIPGDGIQIVLRELMGVKRANYAMLFNEQITAEKALELGLINEVVPADKIYDRALELAEILAAKNRVLRRVTTQTLRYPWKEMLAKELRLGFGTEMWVDFVTSLSHEDVMSDIKDKC